MARKRHLVIFVKAPRLGAVKSRLAKGIGAVPAWTFYRRVTAAVTRRLARDRRWRTLLFVSPDKAESPLWPRSLPRFGQGRGNLGQRMGRAMTILPPGPVVIVGSDIPSLNAGHIARAFGVLGRWDAVFGPAGDGGYWLVGQRRLPRPQHLFANVRWSSEHALADTLGNLPPGSTAALLEELADIDTAADWLAWKADGLACKEDGVRRKGYLG